MVKRVGRNRNETDTSSVNDGIPTIDNNAITIAAANTARTFTTITVRSENGWVRQIPASTDPAIRKGIFLAAGDSYTFPVDDIYTGEISGINDKNGKNPVFYVTERS